MLLKILILPLTKSQTLSDQGQTDLLTKKYQENIIIYDQFKLFY